MRAWRSAEDGARYIAKFKRNELDTVAPERPSPRHEWLNGGWAIPLDWRDRDANAEVGAISRFQFEVMFAAENDKRELRRIINVLKPDTFSEQDSAAVSRLQYRNALVNLWKAFNP